MRIAEISDRRLHITYDAERLCAMDPGIFDPDHLRREGLLIGAEHSPRGAAWVFRYGAGTFLLRHYRHGGALAAVFGDHYVWRSLARTRPAREWRLLRELRAHDLPVPQPAAWRVARRGRLTYQADLITGLIRDCETLHRFLLSKRELSDEGWRRLGRTLRRFHDHQVWHADLTADNVLIDAQGCFHLVDFDRARRRPGQHWKGSNLGRLRHSLLRRRERSPALRYRDAHFRLLLDAYGSGP